MLWPNWLCAGSPVSNSSWKSFWYFWYCGGMVSSSSALPLSSTAPSRPARPERPSSGPSLSCAAIPYSWGRSGRILWVLPSRATVSYSWGRSGRTLWVLPSRATVSCSWGLSERLLLGLSSRASSYWGFPVFQSIRGLHRRLLVNSRTPSSSPSQFEDSIVVSQSIRGLHRRNRGIPSTKSLDPVSRTSKMVGVSFPSM